MEVGRENMAIRVLFRGKTYVVDMPVDATVGELGKQMSHMTGVALPNMKLLVPPRGGFPATALLPASSNQQSLFNNLGFSVVRPYNTFALNMRKILFYKYFFQIDQWKTSILASEHLEEADEIICATGHMHSSKNVGSTA
jgi:hypothetical protein